MPDSSSFIIHRLCYRLALFHRAYHFDDLRMAAERGFGKHQQAVHGYFEAATSRRQNRQFADLVLELLEQLVRQPDGTWSVVSSAAIFDRDSHGGFSPVQAKIQHNICRSSFAAVQIFDAKAQ